MTYEEHMRLREASSSLSQLIDDKFTADKKIEDLEATNEELEADLHVAETRIAELELELEAARRQIAEVQS